MENRNWLWIAAVAAALLVPFRGGPGGDATPAAESEPRPAPAALAPSAPAVAPDLEAALWGFFPDEATRGRYQRSALLVTVPDPLDSGLPRHFDLALDGIQRGLAAEGYLLDRLWLPWLDRDEKKPQALATQRENPGVLIYRHHVEPKLWAVFLVGETPRQGVHKAAFQAALRLATEWDPNLAAPGALLRIAGPYFSGAADSLGLALGAYAGSLEAWVVTGSATSGEVASQIRRAAGWPSSQLHFERTVPEDDRLITAALDYLFDELGWDPHRTVLLVEGDTAYGQSESWRTSRTRRTSRTSRTSDTRGPRVIPFPGRLAPLVSSLEPNAAPPSPQSLLGLDRKGAKLLPLDFGPAPRAVDEVPPLARYSPSLDDFAVSSLLANLNREGVGYVGLVATDPLDKIYLARRLREVAPDILLFTFDNQLLYAHPQLADALNGTLIVTGHPLVPIRLPGTESSEHQVMTAESQQGLMLAVRSLLGPTRQPIDWPGEGFGWVLAVGNAGFWPIATLPLDDARAATGLPQPARPPWSLRTQAAQVSALLLIAGLAWLLARNVPLRSELRRVGEDLLFTRSLWLIALVLLALAALVTILLAVLPFAWSGSARWVRFGPHGTAAAVTVLLVAAAVGGYHRWCSQGEGRRGSADWLAARALTPGAPWLWCIGGFVFLSLASWGALELWTRHQVDNQFFFLRAARFGSGLSPMLSLTFLGVGFYCLLFFELHRRRRAATSHLPWPVPARLDPDGRLAELASRMRPLLSGSQRLSRGWFGGLTAWLVFALVMVGAGLSPSFQPLAESCAWGIVFLVLVLVLLGRGGVCWVRYWVLWRRTRALLRELGAHPLVREVLAQDDLRQELRWSPSQAFSWSRQRTALTTTSVRALRALESARGAAAVEELALLERTEAGRRAAERAQDFAAEVAARQQLEALFAQAITHSEHPDGAADRLVACRLAAYLRHTFEVLRSRLITLLPAGLAALLAVSVYDYHPRYLLTTLVSAALAATAVTAFWSFVEMERDATLSAISGTEAGKVGFNRQLVGNLVSYVGLPTLALIASRVPFFGELLVKLANPLLGSLGGAP